MKSVRCSIVKVLRALSKEVQTHKAYFASEQLKVMVINQQNWQNTCNDHKVGTSLIKDHK